MPQILLELPPDDLYLVSQAKYEMEKELGREVSWDEFNDRIEEVSPECV